MARSRKTIVRNQLAISFALAIAGLAAIAFLAVNVASDLRLLRTANSDNVQWALSQAEVEFLEFEITLESAARETTPDLATLKRRFDIFYSRINTLSEASIYASVRELPEFAANLETLRSFLKQAVANVDASDAVLSAALPDLVTQAEGIRPNVRRLSNSGLNFFATESDKRRDNISVTLTQMAIGVTVLLVTLLLLALYLGRLNRENIRRRSQAVHAKKRMNVVTSTALDAVIVCDADGKILDFNQAAVQIFGYSRQDAMGSDLGTLFVSNQNPKSHDNDMQRIRERMVGKGRMKLEAMRANGERFPVEFAIQSAETIEGEIFISFLRDISHRVAAEQDLVAARDRALAGEKSKTDFLATMSHEIRTPLNGLLGNLTLLGDTNLNQDQARYLKNMDTSGKLLMSHISDVLDITKYDAGKLTLRPVVMNISTLLQDIIDNQVGAALTHNVALDWSWKGKEVDWIFADKERIQHILMNIIGNAVKFTGKGKVTVQAQVLGDLANKPDLEIIVVDTGVGMSKELQSQIFDDFMTGDAAYDREVSGTGLGLGIAQRFVKALGGTITVESKENIGSSFTIRFPIELTPAPVDDVERSAAHSVDRTCRVLLVEDNEINRVVAREMLAAAGHTVVEAHNGQIALDIIGQESFDLILMDISMPVMDGRTAARAIRALDSASAKTPIIALTANAVAEEQEAFLSDGMNAILTKPLSRTGLTDVIRQYAGSQDMKAAAPVRHASTRENRHLKELQATLGADVLQPLLVRFHAEVEEALDFLLHFDQHPLDEIAKCAHKIAGGAATLGTSDFRVTLLEIENAAKALDREAVANSIRELPAIWAATKPSLKIT